MNKYRISLIVSILACIASFFLGKESIQHGVMQNMTISGEIPFSRPKIVETRRFIMTDEMGANPESTLQSREEAMKVPYRIDEGPGGSNNEVQIYLPAFFDQSLRQQNEFSEKIRRLNSYTLNIYIFTFSQFEKEKIRRFFSTIEPQFSRATFRFYDIPVNYFDIFSEFQFHMAGKDLSVEFYGKMFPDGFMLDSVITHIKNLLQNSLSGGDRVNSINFTFEEAGNLYFMLTDVGVKDLINLPTKNLFTKRVLIDSTLEGPGENIKGKEKIEQFFKNSTIQDIQMENVGEKKDGVINLYGF